MKNKTKMITTPRHKILNEEFRIQTELADKIANSKEFISDGDKLGAWRGFVGEKITHYGDLADRLDIERDCWVVASEALYKQSMGRKFDTSCQAITAKGNVLKNLKRTINKQDVLLSEILTRLSHWENLERIIENCDEDSAFEFLIRVSGFRSNV